MEEALLMPLPRKRPQDPDVRRALQNQATKAAKVRYRAELKKRGIVERLIEFETQTIATIDTLVKANGFRNRSQLIHHIVQEGIQEDAMRRILERTKDCRKENKAK